MTDQEPEGSNDAEHRELLESMEGKPQMIFNIDAEGCTVARIVAHDNRFVNVNTPLFSFRRAGKSVNYKSSRASTVRFNPRVLVIGRELKQGDLIGWYSGPCAHEILFRHVCSACGESVREGSSSNVTQYTLPVHNNPTVRVKNEHAQELAEVLRQNLLSSKKLILLVDLDQTLVHTTNKPPTAFEMTAEIHTFTLGTCTYYMKIRPYADQFLNNLSKLFEMQVVTFGERSYADKVVQYLDKDHKYFGTRVLSRDEMVHGSRKILHMPNIFPAGTEMVLMIDDRMDVWDYSEALIWAKPYRFFSEVGDINDPTKLLNLQPSTSGVARRSRKTPPEGQTSPEAQPEPGLDEKELCAPEDTSDIFGFDADPCTSEGKTIEEELLVDAERSEIDEDFSGFSDEVTSSSRDCKSPEKKRMRPSDSSSDAIDEEKKTEKETEEDNPSPSPEDLEEALKPAVIQENDCILMYLETQLMKVHERFYNIYETTDEIVHAGELLGGFRKQVLKGEHVLITGLLRAGEPQDSNRAYRVALMLGADIQSGFTEETTALIVGRKYTEKYRVAKNKGTPLLYKEWIMNSAAYWANLPKRWYDCRSLSSSPPSD